MRRRRTLRLSSATSRHALASLTLCSVLLAATAVLQHAVHMKTPNHCTKIMLQSLCRHMRLASILGLSSSRARKQIE